jgi:hypothetical protein
LETLKIKSLIDGSIYAERPVVGDRAVGAAVARPGRRKPNGP